MLPRCHFLLSILFTALVWIVVYDKNLFYLFLIFFGAFFIDFDHYICAVWKTGKIGLFDSFKYHERQGKKYDRERKKGIRNKGDFHIFHTLEFHLFVFLMGYLWAGFFYLFVGMLFHSGLDVISLVYEDRVYMREFFFINWLRKQFR